MVEANTKIANYHFRFGGQSEFQNVCSKANLRRQRMDLVESMRVAFQESLMVKFKDLGDDSFVIAEVGQNHQGNFDTALEYIDIR